MLRNRMILSHLHTRWMLRHWLSLVSNTCEMLRKWWGGVGWVGDSNVLCTCTHFWCYATGWFSLTCTHVGCYVIDFPWSRTHVRCYASDGVGWGGLGTVTFLALAHIFDATQQDVSLWLAHMLDATSLTFLGLEHMWDATQVMGWGGVGWGQ